MLIQSSPIISLNASRVHAGNNNSLKNKAATQRKLQKQSWLRGAISSQRHPVQPAQQDTGPAATTDDRTPSAFHQSGFPLMIR